MKLEASSMFVSKEAQVDRGDGKLARHSVFSDSAY